jgi:hypothetical protein
MLFSSLSLVGRRTKAQTLMWRIQRRWTADSSLKSRLDAVTRAIKKRQSAIDLRPSATSALVLSFGP